MELILEKIAERQAEVAMLPENVRIWILFMRVLFFAGLVFVPWRKPPRWVVLTMVVTATLILAFKVLMPEFDTIKAGTLIQLLLWLPLAIYLMGRLRPEAVPAIKSGSIWSKVYGLWLAAATGAVLISSALNIFNVAKWLM